VARQRGPWSVGGRRVLVVIDIVIPAAIVAVVEEISG
jgi:hypothetical protein